MAIYKEVRRWVIWDRQNRPGEFEFNCETQNHFCTSLKQAQRQLKEVQQELIEYDEEERIKDLQIFEIKLRKIK